jgi:hypothetical protein
MVNTPNLGHHTHYCIGTFHVHGIGADLSSDGIHLKWSVQTLPFEALLDPPWHSANKVIHLLLFNSIPDLKQYLL